MLQTPNTTNAQHDKRARNKDRTQRILKRHTSDDRRPNAEILNAAIQPTR